MATDDPIFLHWGLHNLLDDLSNPAIGRTSIQNDKIARTEYFQPVSCSIQGCSDVENDEVIAHALQEELSHLAAKEAAEGSQQTNEDPSHASVLAQDWPGTNWQPSRTDSWQRDDMQEEMVQNIDYVSSLNHSNESGDGCEDAENAAPGCSEEFSLFDCEVGKYLTQLGSIPHIPRVNGEIPTVDDASADHRRLSDRLKKYGLSELKIDGDGNCQFRAFADQFYKDSEHHKSVRENVIKQLKSHPELYDGYVPMNFNDYLKKMARSGEWGDHVTLQAAADFYGVKIRVVTSFKDTCFIEILPKQLKSERVIYLSFWAEVHYNSIYAKKEERCDGAI